MSWSAYWKAIRHWWIVVLLSAFAGGTVMFAVTPQELDTRQQIVSYTATATLVVSDKPAPTPKPGEPALVVERVPLDRIALYITTGEIPKRAAAALDYTGDPALLATTIAVTTDSAAGSITVASTSSDGALAARRANTFAHEAVNYFTRRPEMKYTALSILQEATPLPNVPSGGLTLPPTRFGRTVLAAGVGLLVGLVLALILEFIFARLRTRGEVSQALGRPVVAEVPNLKRADRRPGRLLAHATPLSPYADAYRSVRSAILHAPGVAAADDWSQSTRRALPARPQVVLVTSAFASEGKTTSAANLAASFAETGMRVLVLDADLRSPDLHEQFDVPEGSGISDYVSTTSGGTLSGLVRPTKVPGVRMVTAGTNLAHPESLSSRLGPLIKEARRIADITIIDTAPMLAASDVFDILPLVDTVVLVVRSGRLTGPHGERVAELLGRFSTPVTGVVLVSAPKSRANSYGYGYGYGYGAGGKRSKRGKKRPATAPAAPTVEHVHTDDAWAEAEGRAAEIPDGRLESAAAPAWGPGADQKSAPLPEPPMRRARPRDHSPAD